MTAKPTDNAKAIEPDDRDAQIRRRMLSVARLSAERFDDGYVSFALLSAAKDDASKPPENDEHATKLLDELVEWGLLAEERPGDLGGTRPQAKHRRFKLTKKARALWMQQIPPIPGVADDRLL